MIAGLLLRPGGRGQPVGVLLAGAVGLPVCMQEAVQALAYSRPYRAPVGACGGFVSHRLGESARRGRCPQRSGVSLHQLRRVVIVYATRRCSAGP